MFGQSRSESLTAFGQSRFESKHENNSEEDKAIVHLVIKKARPLKARFSSDMLD